MENVYIIVPFIVNGTLNKQFDFQKSNLVTIKHKGRLADKYTCTKSNLVGYRFGLDNYISIPDTLKNRKIYENFLLNG